MFEKVFGATNYKKRILLNLKNQKNLIHKSFYSFFWKFFLISSNSFKSSQTIQHARLLFGNQ